MNTFSARLQFNLNQRLLAKQLVKKIGIIKLWVVMKKGFFFYLFYAFFDVDSESEVRFWRSSLVFGL